MRRDNPLPFLFVLALLFLVSHASRAQAHEISMDSVGPRQALKQALQRMDAHTKLGPHYKNRNAAGRVRTINRAVPPLPTTYAEVSPSGPAFKNRKAVFVPVNSATPLRTLRPRLMGPHYKNRGAKSGGF